MENKRSDFFLYNIINFEEPNIIFFYTVLLFFFIFLSIKINFTVSLLVSLIIYSVLIYYFYINRTENYLYETEKNKQKFDYINSNNNDLESFPKIVDLLFFFNDLKKYNIDLYNQIVDLFSQFTTMYTSCKTDYNLIDQLYRNMNFIRTKILITLNSLLFKLYSFQETNKIIKITENTKKLLNDMLDEIVLLYNKKLYYNGYNNSTSIIDSYYVIANNILSNTNPVNRNDFPKIENLFVW